MARVTRRTRHRSRGRATKTASIGKAMRKRMGVQPGLGVLGTPRGTGGRSGGKKNMTADRTVRGFNF